MARGERPQALREGKMAQEKPTKKGSKNEPKPADPAQAEVDTAVGALLNVPRMPEQPEVKENPEDKKDAD
jgi:hypothetical protein